MSFPRKAILDKVFVEVIPIEDIFAQQGDVELPLESSHVKVQSDRGWVRSVGDCVIMGSVALPMPVAVGDIVYFDEFAYAGRFYLEPADKYRKGLPTYLEIRVGDLKGVHSPTVSDAHAAMNAKLAGIANA